MGRTSRRNPHFTDESKTTTIKRPHNEQEDKKKKNVCEEQHCQKKICKLEFLEKDGDLFDAPEDHSLAHCVAEDLHMNAGIAVEFRNRFKRVGVLMDQKKKSGQVAVLNVKNRFIYYLITKSCSNRKPTIESLTASLKDMRVHVKDNNVKNIAIPTIGCGLDKLDWDEVKEVIREIFDDVDTCITVYHFKQEEMKTNYNISSRQSPRITHTKAPLIKIDTRQLALVFFASAEQKMSQEMKSLNEEYKFFEGFKNLEKNLGNVISLPTRNVEIFAFICLDNNLKISFSDLEKCLQKFDTMHEKLYWLGLDLPTSNDPVLINKIEYMIKFNISKINEIWLCSSWKETNGL